MSAAPQTATASERNRFQLSLAPATVGKAMRRAEAKKGDLWHVPRANIRVIPGFNVRERTPKYLRHIESIKASMLAEGWLESEPIDGFCAAITENGRKVNVVFVIGGHTRLEAHDLAVAEGRHIPYVPVVIGSADASMVDLTVRIWSGNNAMPLSPYEMSKLVKRLVDMQLSEAEVAKRLVVTTQTVRDMLVLSSAPSQVHERVAAGIMSPTLAVEMLREFGPRVVQEVEAAVQRAASEGKERFTRKHVTGSKVAAVIKSSAADAFALIQAISEDSACAQLAPELRERIAQMLHKVSAATPSPAVQAPRAADSLAAFEAAIERISLNENSAANDEADFTFDAGIFAA